MLFGLFYMYLTNFLLLCMFNFFIVTYVPFSVLCVLFVCTHVLYYCHQVSTQLHLYIYIYHIISYHIMYCKFLETNMHFTFPMDSGVYESTVHDGYSGVT
jgi:hypothetical protein